MHRPWFARHWPANTRRAKYPFFSLGKQRDRKASWRVRVIVRIESDILQHGAGVGGYDENAFGACQRFDVGFDASASFFGHGVETRQGLALFIDEHQGKSESVGLFPIGAKSKARMRRRRIQREP